MAGNNPRIIPLDEGWNDEIKAKVSQSHRALVWVNYPRVGSRKRSLSLTDTRSRISPLIFQAIDKLEAMLNGGLKGQTNMFGPKEYVQIYT
jgi:hypothetical protein